MEFDSKRPIYLQIAEEMLIQILEQKLRNGDKIPSIRELASDTEVNPNTVNRTYSYLQDNEIIYNKRGIGYFVSDGAYEKVKEMKKRQFIEEELPRLFTIMTLLGLDFSDLKNEYQKGEYNEKK